MRPVDAYRLAGENSGGQGADDVGPSGKDANYQSRRRPVVHPHVLISIAVEFDDAG
jgi:hypothetical protein